MKKLLLSGLFIALNSFVWAQAPVIGYNDIIDIGDKFFGFLDTAIVIPNPGPAGENQSWDFSAVQPHETIMLTCVPISQAPDADKFASSSFALHFSFHGFDNHSYYTKNTKGLYKDDFQSTYSFSNSGVNSESYEILAQYNPKSRMLNFPTTFGTTWKDTSRITETIKGQLVTDSVRVTETEITTSVGDAWGSIKTPTGLYTAVRVNQFTATTFLFERKMSGQWMPTKPSYSYDTSYLWYAKNHKAPVFELTKKSFDSKQPYSVNFYSKNQPTGLEDHIAAASLVSTYPNPAKGTFVVRNATEMLSLTDVSGMPISFTTIITAEGVKVNTEALEAGLYLAKVKVGNKTQVIKVAIAE